jgi:Tol biopolymer transport system component
VVAAWRGNMWRVDRATGARLEDLPITGDGTHPDWSPDNTQLVYSTGSGDAPGNASLAVIPWLEPSRTWGTPRILVQQTGDRSNLFPMFSRDGKWIAYSRGKGGHGDLQAQLYIADGATGTSVELVRANRVVSNQTGDGQTENSQPTWAPPGDLDWVAFNSMREYGVVLPDGTQQIWVAAVDLAQVGAGADGSYPAFRLQFQGLDENNHRAFWTDDIRDPPPPADAGVGYDGPACIPAGGMCDPTRDTCCDAGYVCDTRDSGMTYTCLFPVIP